MAVPIRVEFEHHEPLLQRIWINQPEISVEIPLPAEPTKILFNFRHFWGLFFLLLAPVFAIFGDFLAILGDFGCLGAPFW